MPTGQVRFFNLERGFGFIIPDAAGEADLFVHISDVRFADHLLARQRVAYDVGVNERNGMPKAINVTPL